MSISTSSVSSRDPSAMRRLSVVIPNYNYARFVGTAIQSALALDWPDVEIIVVDDGSTDNSRTVIRAFSDRVTVLEQANAGARMAANAGFAASTGDVVIFLDSDDVLERSIASEIAAVWRPGISKVQVQMQRVDTEGRRWGGTFPEYRSTPTPKQIRRWMLETAAYPTPPGSGNAYSRDFLRRIFPLDNRCGEFSDSACLAAAPFLGDVVTIAKPLVHYRLHGNNDSDLLAAPLVRFPVQVERAYQRHLYALDVSGTAGGPHPLKPLFRGRHLLQIRIAERRLNPTLRAPIPGDNRWRMFRNTFGALIAPGPEGLKHRLTVVAWCLATLIAPSQQAQKLIRVRYARKPTILPAVNGATDPESGGTPIS